ncbi:hypothetical protein [Hoeflea sp.]|uniref:hypothetical protein n=1 Tax=Hoeflea sp. TaxID=1940281 RepID=UPI003B02D68C
MEGYLLCRPRGGLNDLLCQVESCWQYAERFDRTLVVDTCRSRLNGSFSDFFEPQKTSDSVVFDLTGNVLETLNRSTCFPPTVQGRLESYESVFTGERNYVESGSSDRLTFDFTKRLPQAVLVHEQCGGGTASFQLLSRLKLSAELQSIARTVLAGLDFEYVAVHVRNTNYKTEYQSLFRTIARRVSGKKLLVCSDDLDLIGYAKSYFTVSDVFSVSDLPQYKELLLHGQSALADKSQPRSMAIMSILDLLMLANANSLYYANVKDGFPSGFSRLAAYLCDNKNVLGKLLGTPENFVAVSSSNGSRKISPPNAQFEKMLRWFNRKITNG